MGAGNQDQNRQPIQAVIFDLDGVLLDSEWSAFEAWKDVVRHYGGALDDEIFPQLMGTTQEVTAEIARRASGLDFPVEEACAMAWEKTIQRLQQGVSPLAGARELVAALRQRGLPLAIASNSLTHYIDIAIHGLGLGEAFPIRVSVDQVAEGKPAPDVYLEAAARLGVAPQRCLAIEDSPVGVRAGAAAGMRVIVVPNRGEENPTSDYAGAWRLYPSLVAVRAALEEILSAPLEEAEQGQ